MTDEELVRAVAQEVMGFIAADWRGTHWGVWRFGDGKGWINQDEWNPLTNANHRDMVVERMRELGWDWLIISQYKKWSVQVGKDEQLGVSINESLGHSVCEAALKAVRHG